MACPQSVCRTSGLVSSMNLQVSLCTSHAESGGGDASPDSLDGGSAGSADKDRTAHSSIPLAIPPEPLPPINLLSAASVRFCLLAFWMLPKMLGRQKVELETASRHMTARTGLYCVTRVLRPTYVQTIIT